MPGISASQQAFLPLIKTFLSFKLWTKKSIRSELSNLEPFQARTTSLFFKFMIFMNMYIFSDLSPSFTFMKHRETYLHTFPGYSLNHCNALIARLSIYTDKRNVNIHCPSYAHTLQTRFHKRFILQIEILRTISHSCKSEFMHFFHLNTDDQTIIKTYCRMHNTLKKS